MRRRPSSKLLIALFSLMLTSAACDSDETGSAGADRKDAGADTQVDDAALDAASSQDAVEDTAGEPDPGDATSEPDAAEPNDTSSEPDTGADTLEDATPSDDAGLDADPTDVAADTRDACGTGISQTCAFPASASTCAQGDWGASSFIDTFVLEDNGTCCFDLDGDGTKDSSLARLKPIVEQLTGFDFNEIIRVQIESGELNYLFTYSGWTNPVNDSQAQLDVVFGNSTSTWNEKITGNGAFQVDPSSLDDAGEPISQLAPADVCDSALRVRGGVAPLRVPIGTELIQVALQDVRISTDVIAPTDLSAGGRVALTNGELGGWISLTDIFEGLNGVANACGCLQKDVFVQQGTSWSCVANQADQSSCANDPGAPVFCQQFLSQPAICGLAASTIERYADLDKFPAGQPDNNNDALSVGATFSGKGAALSSPR